MITAHGTNGKVYFDGQTVTISRSGLIARSTVGKGSKTIPIASVTAVQFKPAGLSAGMIQFTLSGGSERRSRFGRQSRDAMSDENSVTFHLHRQGDFKRLADAVRDAISGAPARQVTPASEPPPARQGPPPGWYQDPDGTGQQRWWDGAIWTEHRQP